MAEVSKIKPSVNPEFPTIACGSLIHNKSWAIQHHVQSIYNLDYPKENISLIFYINDSVDGTKEKLLAMLKEIKAEGKYRRVIAAEQDYGYRDLARHKRPSINQYVSRHSSPEKTVDDHAHFARVRNEWLKLREDEDYYFSIDSDVIIKQPFALRQLLEHKKDVVAIPVNNAENRSDGYDPLIETMNKFLTHPDPNVRSHIRDIHEGRVWGGAIEAEEIWNYGMIYNGALRRFKRERCLFEVDLTGACYLFKAELIENGVCYGPNYAGEDFMFCSLAKSLGYRLYVDGTLDTEHFMDFNPHEKQKEVAKIA